MIPPALRDFFDQLGRQPAFLEALAKLRAGNQDEIRLQGLTPTAQALFAVLLSRHTERPVLLAAESGVAAEALTDAAEAFFGLLEENPSRAAPVLLPAHDVTPYDGLSPHAEIHEQRGIALWRLAEGTASVIVAPVAALQLKTAPADAIRNLALALEVGDEFYLEDLEQSLGSCGYVRQEPVEAVGQFSVRGGIIDIFSAEAHYPVRIEMSADEVESIREFDPETQKSIRRIERVTLLPLSEVPTPGGDEVDDDTLLGPGWEFSAAQAARRQSTVFDLAPKALLVLCEPDALEKSASKLAERIEADRAEAGGETPPPEQFYLSWEQFRRAATGRSIVFDRDRKSVV